MNSTVLVPKPNEIPKNLTSLSQSYMMKASMAVASIILFFILYWLLVVALGYSVYWAFTYDIITVNKLTILGKLAAIAGSIMLFIFTLKFIFKLRNPKPTNRIKLYKKDFPELFNFIDEICRETGAPKPKAIYVDPDVNAYVSYTNIWLSLIFPTGKDLTIGLGLVSALNLSEFKAVMSHEFGHFSQKSMKIGSYIHSANTIIHDMIFNRDKWDELLDRWRGSDIRLSAAAWIITPIIWLIRKALELFYTFLNYMHSALSREMEFNADKVAVKTTGSVAIVSALWKLNYGSTYWNTVLDSAYHATKKNVYTQNLYLHNSNFIEKNRNILFDEFTKLEVDKTGSKQYFSNSNNSTVSMYASHPPNDHREKNAKTPFVACELDERSPWILFKNKENLQEKMSQSVYENYLGKKPEKYVAFEDFEKFIEAESRNTSLTDELENTFQNRFITIPESEDYKNLSPFSGDFNFKYDELKKELHKLMKPVKELEEKMNYVIKILNGEVKDKNYDYKGITYTKKNLQEVFSIMHEDREKIFDEDFIKWDEKFIQSFYQLAKSAHKENTALGYYTQQKKIVSVYRKLISTKNTIITEINVLQSKSDFTQTMVNNLGEEINQKVFQLNEKLNELNGLEYMPLPNIDTIEELKEAIIEGGKFQKESGPIFENGGIGIIFNKIDSALANCNRVENKNIDQILLFHHSLIQN